MLLASVVGVLSWSVSALAAPGAPDFVPPALKVAAVRTGPVGGTGSVEVKVFVTTAGAAGAVAVSLATNPADESAALDLARRSTYVPAQRDGRPFATYGNFLVQCLPGGAQFLSLAASDAARSAAFEAIDKKQYARAESGLLAYLKTVPDDSRVREVLAGAYALDGRIDDALAAFDRAGYITPALEPAVAHLYTDRAVRSLAGNDTAAAVADLDRATSAVATLPAASRAAALVQVAAVFASAGRFDRAGALRADALKLAPAVSVDEPIADAIAERVRTQRAAHDTAGAVQTLEAGATLLPAHAHAWLREAALVLAASQGDGSAGWAAVRSEADKALALDSSDVTMNYIAGYALIKLNDRATARMYFVRAQDLLKNGATAEDPAMADKVAAALKQIGEGN